MSNTEDIKTIAVIDLETNGLPWQQNNTCAITELSIYAFAASCFSDAKEDVIVLQLNDDMDVIENFGVQPPELPRVLHKITMMINPGRPIDPVAGKLSNLSNDMLDKEALFDINTANCLLMFLERLEKPICFVAHNGWSFDYPIIRYVFETINMAVPSSIYCIDSFKAFREIDEKQPEIEMMKESGKRFSFSESTSVKVYQGTQEITPDDESKTEMEHRICDISPFLASESENRQMDLQMFRTLFAQAFKPKTRFPKKGTYVLGNIFERIFQQPAEQLHRAESDVAILTELILHYGLVFLAYAEERKRSFDEVPKLGCRSD